MKFYDSQRRTKRSPFLFLRAIDKCLVLCYVVLIKIRDLAGAKSNLNKLILITIKRRRKVIRKFLVLLILVVFAACGNDNNGDNSGGNSSGNGNGDVVSLTRIYLAPTDQTTEIRTTVQYSALGVYSDNTNRDITDEVVWTSSDPAVATISADGLATAVAVGSTEINATLSGVSETTTLVVIRLVPISIAITPLHQIVAVGETQQFTATGTYASGSTKDLTNEVAWTLSDPAVATIGADGLATADAVGSTEICASYEGVSTSGKNNAVLSVCDDRLGCVPLKLETSCGSGKGIKN